MNNFKVRVIKQQWGIIKHQAALSDPQSRYQIIRHILVDLHNFSADFKSFFSRFESQSQKMFFLDIFA